MYLNPGGLFRAAWAGAKAPQKRESKSRHGPGGLPTHRMLRVAIVSADGCTDNVVVSLVVKLKRLFEAAGGARRQLFVGRAGHQKMGDPQGPLGGSQHGA
jgi:hypothetical protein